MNRVALITAASAIALAGHAKAADLGGSCCEDLEERVAELEATTASKGNRKVSLTVSGQIHQAVLFWDASTDNNLGNPSSESNVYVGTNNISRSRFSFKGNAQINTDWSAGFFMEFGVRSNDLQDTSQNVTVDAAGLDIRHEAFYIKSKTFGTIWLGQTSTALDGIIGICLGCGLGNSPNWDDTMPNVLTASGQTFGSIGSASGNFSGDGDRMNIIRYISPTLAGFSLSGSTGGDDYWDSALRYAGEFGAIRIAGGIAYAVDTNGVDSATFGADGCTASDADGDRECTSLGMSASVQHVPTGLYISGSYGIVTDEKVTTNQDEDTSWFLTAGINQKWISVGKTNIWGMYGEGERTIGYATGESTLTQYGVGIEQKIDSAAMDVYIHYKRLEAEENRTLTTAGDSELDMVFVGARIKF